MLLAMDAGFAQRRITGRYRFVRCSEKAIFGELLYFVHMKVAHLLVF
jgi:hypothetical protein